MIHMKTLWSQAVRFLRLPGPTQWQIQETHQVPSTLMPYPTKHTRALTLTVTSSRQWSHQKSKLAHNSKDSSNCRSRMNLNSSHWRTISRQQTLQPLKELRKLWVLWNRRIAVEEILSWTRITVVMRSIQYNMWSASTDTGRHASKLTATSFIMDWPYVTATSNWSKWREL